MGEEEATLAETPCKREINGHFPTELRGTLRLTASGVTHVLLEGKQKRYRIGTVLRVEKHDQHRREAAERRDDGADDGERDAEQHAAEQAVLVHHHLALHFGCGQPSDSFSLTVLQAPSQIHGQKQLSRRGGWAGQRCDENTLKPECKL